MFVRFEWLKANGIVGSRPQLKNLQEKYGFPSGRQLGPCTRVWDLEKEIQPWLDSRPTGPAPLKGAAKILHAGGKVAPRRDRIAKNAEAQ